MNEVNDFLANSNAIEGVYDEDSFKQAIYAWEFLMEQDKLTKGVVLKTHKILMLNQSLLPSDKGYFRNIMVYIGNKPAINPISIDDRIDHWILNVNDVALNAKNESEIFKEKITKAHHIEYEKIHPFVDGNGRTGRLFMNWERKKVGMPLLVIHEGKEQQDYYKWFK